jgi:glycine betaine catabolism A
MQRERAIGLLGRLRAVVEASELEATCGEGSVAIDRYVSKTRLDAERRVLFRRSPLAIAREADVPLRCSFITHDDTGTPILVTRDDGGKIHAMLNVCRHRGARLVDRDAGHAKAFVCPYHAWPYDLCGRLGPVPLARCFPTLVRDESALVELPCEQRHGFVWVVPSAKTTIDIAASLGPFDDDLAAFDLDKHVVFERSRRIGKANWKLVMDAFLEGYHVKALHQRTLSRFFNQDMIFDTYGGHVRTVGARRNFRESTSQPSDGWDLRACATVFYNVFPNSILVFHPQAVSHIALYPRAADEVVFVHTMLVPHEPRDDEERAACRKTWELIDGKVFAEEDLAIAESIQSGIEAGAGGTFRLGTIEAPIAAFHAAIDAALNGKSHG